MGTGEQGSRSLGLSHADSKGQLFLFQGLGREGRWDPSTLQEPKKQKRIPGRGRVDGACSQLALWSGLGPSLSSVPEFPDHHLRAQAGPSGRPPLTE